MEDLEELLAKVQNDLILIQGQIQTVTRELQQKDLICMNLLGQRGALQTIQQLLLDKLTTEEKPVKK